ncbi:helix-turn-helix domain-containing protein [Paenibacillus xylanilyticus]|uniref:AraC family transcriptional regulator n=1 Tax=Paenibacillus xylanilyticus TaxID=248903 RepID=A0A7Y6C3M1_9BACL|nr:helix-turn-helix domain-containing protein [Paenibacillus xylanilyticus]NUU79576.1 AraC family transcriptional regulator [Paenibacillus xylanilyticus]
MRPVSYLHKIIVFGTLLSTLPILLTGIAAFTYSVNQTELHRIQTNKQLLLQMQSNVEHKLATVSYMLDQATRSPFMLQSLSAPLPNMNLTTANQLQSEFQHMRSWEPLMDITLVNQTQDWLIDHAGLYLNADFPLALPMQDLLSKTLTSGWQLAPSSVFNHNERSSDSGCIYHIALARSIPHLNASSGSALIAGIPACSMQNPVIPDDRDLSASELIIINREQRILVHPNPIYIGQPLSAVNFEDSESNMELSELLSPTRFPASSGYREVRISDAHYSLNYTQSPLKGWTYILITPMNVLTQQSVETALYTMCISIVLLLLSLLFSWVGSRRLHIPVRELLKQLGIGDRALLNQHLQESFAPHQDEFEQIKAHITQLSASRSQMEHKLNQYVLQLRNQLMMNMYLGRCSPATLYKSISEQGYNNQLIRWQQMAVLTVQADLVNQTKYGPQDLDLLLFAIQNIMEESIDEEHQFSPTVMEQTIVTVIGSVELDNHLFSRELYKITTQLQHQIGEILNLQVSFGFSQPVTSILEVHQAYVEAMGALQQRMKLGSGVIVQYEAEAIYPSQWTLPYPESLEYNLIHAIQSADEAEASVLLQQLLQSIFRMDWTAEEYQVALTRLLMQVLQMMHDSGIRLAQISPGHSSIFKELLALQYAAEVEQWFISRIMGPVIEIFRERQYAQHQQISEKMIAIVQQEYDTDLTLEECAMRLHYNASYLSSVFRKETGCAFSEYLAQYRFKMARKWLDETELTVKDIAARLRYNNPQNFIRSFRKWEGITPGQYRERRQKAFSSTTK